MARPSYRVQVLAAGASFTPGAVLAEFERAKNIGYADYANDVPEAFFTIAQEDSKIKALRGVKTAHVRILRDGTNVWSGWLGEREADSREAIFYAYGYLSSLYTLLSDWNVAYTNAQINTIVSDHWTRAKTTLTSSPIAWVTTGTIEAPVTTTGGGTAIVLPTYKLFYKRILFALREMATLGIGDTANTVLFEITPAGTFNFWKNRGVDQNVRWEFGGDYVMDFLDRSAVIFRRNDLLTVGMNPNDTLLRFEALNAGDITNYGRFQEPIFFSWIRDSTELQRGANARLAKSIRDDIDVAVQLKPNVIVPPRGAGALFGLADRVNIRIDRGITNITAKKMVYGYQVLVARGDEHLRVLLQDRPGV